VEATARIWIVDDEPSRRFPVYCRGNVGEVFPNVVTPLTGSLIGDAVQRSQERLFLQLGAVVPRDLARAGRGTITGVFGGYMYGNLSLGRLMGVRSPGMKPGDVDAQLFGTTDAGPYQRQRGDRSPVATLRLGRSMLRALSNPDLSWLDAERRDVEQWRAGLRPPAEATDHELLERVHRLPRWLELHMYSLLQASVYTGMAAAIVQRFADRVHGESLGATRLLAGVGGVETTEASIALWQLSRSPDGPPPAELDAFLQRFGSRGPDEYELASPTWGIEPDIALAALDRLRLTPDDADPRAALERQAAARAEATARVRATVPGAARPLFDRALRTATRGAAAREQAKATLVLALYSGRLALFELARRARDRGGPVGLRDSWLVTIEELPRYVASPGAFDGVIDERRALRDDLQAREPPFVFEGRIPPPDTWPRRDRAAASRAACRATTGDVLSGLGVSHGVARGRVRIVRDPAIPGGLQPGEVLVAPITDPAWTPLFLVAEAVVADVGALQSHAAIVARELGIPAVVSVHSATSVLRNGDEIEVDGDRGVVRVLGV
jgi:pyruvate,water dikinase